MDMQGLVRKYLEYWRRSSAKNKRKNVLRTKSPRLGKNLTVFNALSLVKNGTFSIWKVSKYRREKLLDGISVVKDLPFKSGQLTKCIYCTNSLPAQNFEHVFNSCWGGKHSTGQIICNACNASFAPVDRVFKPYTDFVMNAWQIKGERQKEIPVISTDSNYTIEKGAKPVKISEISLEQQADGGVRVRGNVQSKSEARRLVLERKSEIEASIGRPLNDDDMNHIYAQIRESRTEEEQVGKLVVSASLDFQAEYRSVAHTLIKCITLYNPDTSTSDDFQAVRAFARYDEGDWSTFAIDAEPIVTCSEGIDPNEARYNSAEIFYSAWLGKIIGVVTILGRVKRWIVLSHSYKGPDEILFVMERIHGGGKLDSVAFRKKIEMPTISLLNTTLTAPDPEQLTGDLARVAQSSISIDAPYVEFIRLSNKLFDKHTVLTKEFLNALTDMLIDYQKTIANVTGNNFNEDDVRKKLWCPGLENLLEKYNGSNLETPEVMKTILRNVENSISAVFA